MNNNENNNLQDFGFEPQKPFTDYTNPNPVEFKRTAESVNENDTQQEFEPQPVFHSEPTQPVYQNEPAQPVHNDFSQPTYQNSYQPIPPQHNRPMQNAPYPPFRGNVPPYQPPVPPVYNPPQAPVSPTYNPSQVPKSKANKGLVAIIIVLSVLLVSSFIGILVYIATNTPVKPEGGNSFYDFTMPEPDYTFPQSGEEDESIPANNHESSDYSDKTLPDYKGLSLSDKPKDAQTNKNYNAETSFDKASQSVVGVVCYLDKVTTVENCDSQGSGIIISSDGYVVTNAHVIANSRTAYIIQVVTADGKTYDAGVVGYDTRTDIAVLKMDNAKDLKPATFGDSEKITLGEDIIAIGNPGGLDYQNSITKGIVSAVNRELSSTSLVKYIQTDAAINPGNSGGPIVNMYGQVIGIATSKIVSEQFEGMGFAIPSADAKKIVDSIIKNGYVSGRVKIGISGYAIDSATAEYQKCPAGILVDSISPDGPCHNTGLQPEDIITEVDGKKISSFADIYSVLEEHKPGDKVKIKYYRPDTKQYSDTEIILQEDVI